ncbi:MAG: DNA methyltransferase, partial [Candidatus Hodarchaeales archaeon]
LDEVFGEKNFVIEFLIRRMKKNLSKKQAYRQTHLINHSDYLFVYGMSSKAKLKTCKINKKRRKNQDEAEIQYFNDNLWIDIAGYEKAKKTLYPTENSESLLTRVIQIASNKGDIIADFFCGSGTTLAIAEKLGRKWIGVDIGHYAMHESKKRILRNPERNQFSKYCLNSPTFMHEVVNENEKKYLSIKTENSSVVHLEINQKKLELELQILDFVPYQKDQLLLGHKDSDSIFYINYIDYWMINWEYEREIFSVDWYSIRVLKGKKVLKPVYSFASYKYPKPGTYVVATSIIDVFGNIMRYKFNIII